MTTGLGATYRFMGVGPLATPTQLRADLRALGVEPGSVLMVHTALSKVGFIPGGAQAMIEALLDVLGPGGTLVMPAFSASITDPQFWTNPPVPEEWWPTIREETPAYDGRKTPTRMLGIVAELFRTWPGVTSVSRKSVLPVYEELNGLLFYPVQYEGEESSYNVFYTGAAPNQQAIPAVEYLMSEDGGGAKRWILLGTDYVYPRTTNKILRYFLKSKGVKESDIYETYTPFGHSDYQTIVKKIKEFSAGKPTAVVSTINGDSNVPFYKELANQKLKAEDVPVVAFSVGEEELRGIDTSALVGHLAAWNYFMSMDNPQNKEFVSKWKAYVKKNKLPGGDKRVTNDPMEATYIGIKMWAQAVEQAGTTDVDAVRQAVGGQTVKSPSGFTITMDAKNHHLHKPVVIGEITPNGQFDIVWQTEGPVRAAPWSPYVPESKNKVADWTYPWICGNCTEPQAGKRKSLAH